MLEPEGEFLIAGTNGPGALRLYALDPLDGRPTEVAGSPFATASGIAEVAALPVGDLVVASLFDGTLAVHRLDRSQPALVEVAGSPLPIGGIANMLVASPDGRHLYVAVDDAVLAFEIDGATGVPTAVDPQPTPFGFQTTVQALAIDADGATVYAALTDFDQIASLRRDPATGALQEVGTRPTVGASPLDLVLRPDGAFLYSLNVGGDSVSVLAVDPATGALALTTTQPDVAEVPLAFATDAAGERLFVVDTARHRIGYFRLDPDDGSLAPAGRVRTAFDPEDLVLASGTTAPRRRAFALVASNSASGDGVSSYRIGSDGRLTDAPGTPLATGHTDSVGVDPRGAYVFAANSIERDISILRIDPATAQLTEVPNSPVSVGNETPILSAVDPSGRFLYVTTLTGMLTFRFDREAETLTQVGSPLAADRPHRIAMDPVGRFLFFVEQSGPGQGGAFGPPILRAARIDPQTGELTSTAFNASLSSALELRAIDVDVTAQFLTATTSGPARVHVLRIDPVTGGFTAASPEADPGIDPFGAAFDPTGRFLYVADLGAFGRIAGYRFDKSTGELDPLDPFLTETQAFQSFDLAGARVGQRLFLYNMAKFENFVESFELGLQTGIPSPLDAQGITPTGSGPTQIESVARYE